MRVSVTDAKAQLTDLVRRAEAGDEVILTRHGQPVVRLTTIVPKPDLAARGDIIAALQAAAAAKLAPGPGAAWSQDCLYGDDGLPG
ncbi:MULTISPECIES: type II toxin-antitoxin system prevent-host-death family antitoxin [unclassified Methylobacterium]|uniref:type II toxin-antitoxin system Phd/YefM family antitoxin n=1 Tax=unclassified Methylobacterium TaxID=2615210 RepID=UPI002269BA94|nr:MULTISPECIES: type II toxin-antitoxin system prevent-host-death family antitoxin [unclassified Methylobacterium]